MAERIVQVSPKIKSTSRSRVLVVAWLVLRELAEANRRFDDFVRELNRFNARHEGDPS